jgi:hypothetical protein
VDRIVPGAFVTRRGVMGYGISTNGTGAISIRGIGGSPNTGVLMVVDGRPDYQGLMGHPLPDFYSLSDAGSVSVTEGPASVLYGSNAMGGAIEVKNWEPAERMTTRLTAGLGSFRTGQYNLTNGARFRRGFYTVNAGVAHTAGDRPSSAFRDQDGTVTAGYDLSDVWKASIDGRYGHFHVEDPGPAGAPLANSYANVGRGGFSANLENATAATWGYARAYSSYGNHYITDGFRSTDRTTGFRLDQNVSLAPSLTLELGSDVVNFGGRARNASSRLDYGEHEITSAAGFARAQWSATRRLRLHPMYLPGGFISHFQIWNPNGCQPRTRIRCLGKIIEPHDGDLLRHTNLAFEQTMQSATSTMFAGGTASGHFRNPLEQCMNSLCPELKSPTMQRRVRCQNQPIVKGNVKIIHRPSKTRQPTLGKLRMRRIDQDPDLAVSQRQ